MWTDGAMQVLNFLFSLAHSALEKETTFIKTSHSQRIIIGVLCYVISEFTLGICSICASGYTSENAKYPTEEQCLMRGCVEGT